MFSYVIQIVGVAICLCPIWTTAPAQPGQPPYTVSSQHFSVEQGLPNRSVTHMAQDPQGFVWIGTLNSAYRFDGHRFVPLPPRPRQGHSQLTVYVDHIQTDPAGWTWFFEAQAGGHRTARIWLPGEQHPVSPEERFNRSLPTHSFMVAEGIGQRGHTDTPPAPVILFTTKGGVGYQHIGQGRFRQLYRHPEPVVVHYVRRTRNGTLFLTLADPTETRFQLVELDSSGRLRRQVDLPKLLIPICTEADGRLYLYHAATNRDLPQQQTRLSAHQLDGFLYRLDPNGPLTAQPIPLPENPFPNPAEYVFYGSQIEYDSHHDLFWFMGNGVLFAWNPQRGILFDQTTLGLKATQIPFLSRLLVDRSGAVWLATGNGFLLINLEPNRFNRYLYKSPNDVGGRQQATRGIVQQGNWLWINAQISWWVDLRTGQAQPVRQSKSTPADQSPAVGTADGGIWTAKYELYRIDPAQKRQTVYSLRGINSCSSIWPDGRRNLWLGYDGGISYFDVGQGKNRLFTRYNGFAELADNRVNGFFPDKQAGGVWVAASSGLYLLDTLRGIVARYSVEQPTPRHLPFNHITFVHPDPDQPGYYWLATLGGGLIRWHRASGRFRQFTQTNGLPNDNLYCLYMDHPVPARRRDPNRLWFTTDYGLVSFNKQTGVCQTFLPRNGTTHEEFNLTSHLQAPDGRLFLGGLNGVMAFQPNDMPGEPTVKAPLVLSSYQQLDAKTGNMIDLTASYHPGQPIRIPPNSRVFALVFALLDYRYLNQTRLWYRIPGWQETWTEGSASDLRIHGLPPGDYELQARMRNLNNQWISDVLTVPLIVEAPFYQRWWFLLLSLLMIGKLIYLFVWWRHRRLLAEKRRLETEVARRTTQIESDKAIIEQDKAVIEQQAGQLRENALVKARFLANVTHEFRTPLTLLLGPLHRLSQRNTDPANAPLLAGMEHSARYLQQMVNDLLDLSRVDANQLRLNEQKTDLDALINQIVNDFAVHAQFGGISLTTVDTQQAIWMWLDGPKVQTVVRNLLANALRFTAAGGSVTLRLSREPGRVTLSVADTGSGIHPDDLPHIFDRYYQSCRPDAPLRGGTGIGLALCHDYCQLWNSELTVESRWGQGSTFTFVYPLVAVTKPLEEQPPTYAHLPAPTLPLVPSCGSDPSRDRLLLVEDNPDMAAYLQTLLTPHYAVHTCREGREAWQWLTSQPTDQLPQLIVTDLMMPDMDGMGLLNLIQDRAVLRPIPVLMLTARTDQAVRLQALRLGVADYLTKPFDEEELLTRLHNLLERGHERQLWRALPAPADAPPIQTDQNWLQQIEQVILTRLADSTFQVTELAEAATMSQSQFYRQLKELTGLSPIQFVQEVRLQTARDWLENRRYETVKQVAHSVGFQKPSYFAQLFRQRFGITPGSLLASAERVDNPVLAR